MPHAVSSIIVILLLSCLYLDSSYGTNFFIAAMKNYNGETERLFLHVSTPSMKNVSYFVYHNSLLITNGSVTKGNAQNITLKSDLVVINSSFLYRDRGIHIVSKHGVISVILVNYRTGSTGKYIAFPYYKQPLSEYIYFAVSSNSIGSNTWSLILLVGNEDNTTITITPTEDITVPQDIQSLNSPLMNISSSTSFTVVLHRLQTFTFGVANFGDMTGTKIVSDKPVTVLSGHECGNIPNDVNFCEHMVVQIPPTFTWGKKFFLTPFAERTAGQHYKLVASENSTDIYAMCGTHYIDIPTLNAAEVTVLASSYSTYCYLESAKPMLVTQLAVGSGREINGVGDPTLTVNPPIEQFSSNFSFYLESLDTIDYHYINILQSNDNNIPAIVSIDGIDLNRYLWLPLKTKNNTIVGYFSQVRVNPEIGRSDHYVTINSNATLSALVYGFGGGSQSGYSYTAGLQHIPLCDNVCENGVCDNNQCICNDGWNGNYCNQRRLIYSIDYYYYFMIAICDPECENGVCIAPGMCDCDESWEGFRCRLRKS